MLSTLNPAVPILPSPHVNGRAQFANPANPGALSLVHAQPQRQAPAAAPDLAAMLLRALDHAGRGMLLVAAGGRVLHANRLAQQSLHSGAALRMVQGLLQARDHADALRLDAALQAGLFRGLRDLLTLGKGDSTTTVAVLPIESEGSAAVLVSLEQPRCGQDMAVQWFARQHKLTAAETGVLNALREGLSPSEIAELKVVALSTVRTQIGQLRQKTGSRSIRQLLDQVGGLPPMMQLVS